MVRLTEVEATIVFENTCTVQSRVVAEVLLVCTIKWFVGNIIIPSTSYILVMCCNKRFNWAALHIIRTTGKVLLFMEAVQINCEKATRSTRYQEKVKQNFVNILKCVNLTILFSAFTG